MPGAMRAVERRAMADRDLDIVQPVQFAAVIMDAPGRHDAKPHGRGDVDQRPCQGDITPHTIALQLDEEPVFPEHLLAALGDLACCRESFCVECPRQQALTPAAREYDQPFLTRCERLDRKSTRLNSSHSSI